MKYPVFAIRDVKTTFMAPVIEISDQSAIRNFHRAVSDSGSLMNFSPADFDLYHVGYYDDQSGALEPVSPVQFVASGRDLFGVREDA